MVYFNLYKQVDAYCGYQIMKAIIASLNFNPGHLSHLMANYKLLSEANVSVSLLWHPAFNEYCPSDFSPKFSNVIDLFRLGKGDIFIVWFPSISALVNMLFLKVFGRGKIIYIFHEPFDSIQSYLAAGFSPAKTIRIVLVSFVNRLLVACSDKIILASDKAYITFKIRYRNKNSFVKIPLMFDDELKDSVLPEKRSFISYIGTVAEDHAFKEFVNYVAHALEWNLFPDFKFLIATRSVLPVDASSLLSRFSNNERLIVVSGSPLTNRQINHYFADSVIVWNAYKRSMQSGILPKAYMFGTPVISAEGNRSEYFVDGKTGTEINKGYNVDEISAAIGLVTSDFYAYSQFCREKFLSCFYYKALSEKFLSFVFEDERKA